MKNKNEKPDCDKKISTGNKKNRLYNL